MTLSQVEDAVERGMVKAFGRLGLPIDTTAHSVEVQRDFAFLRDMRTGTQSIKAKSYWLVFAMFLTAICGFVWAGFQATAR